MVLEEWCSETNSTFIVVTGLIYKNIEYEANLIKTIAMLLSVVGKICQCD